MARTREFDTEAAVSRAMELFWTRGYEATSVRDLTRHLGIGQGSLYAAFGDKDGLYRAALDHYRATLAAAALRDLEAGDGARAAIRTMLLERARIATEGGGRGCLAVNAACERLPHDPATARTVRDMQDAGRDALTDLLRAAAERGEIAPGTTRTPWPASWSPSSTACWSPPRSPRTSAPSNRSWRSPWAPSTDLSLPAICNSRSR